VKLADIIATANVDSACPRLGSADRQAILGGTDRFSNG
jgi:hypothetical protein